MLSAVATANTAAAAKQRLVRHSAGDADTLINELLETAVKAAAPEEKMQAAGGVSSAIATARTAAAADEWDAPLLCPLLVITTVLESSRKKKVRLPSPMKVELLALAVPMATPQTALAEVVIVEEDAAILVTVLDPTCITVVTLEIDKGLWDDSARATPLTLEAELARAPMAPLVAVLVMSLNATYIRVKVPLSDIGLFVNATPTPRPHILDPEKASTEVVAAAVTAVLDAFVKAAAIVMTDDNNTGLFK